MPFRHLQAQRRTNNPDSLDQERGIHRRDSIGIGQFRSSPVLPPKRMATSVSGSKIDVVIFLISLGNGLFQERKTAERRIFMIQRIRRSFLHGCHDMRRRRAVWIPLAQINDIMACCNLGIRFANECCEELGRKTFHSFSRLYGESRGC